MNLQNLTVDVLTNPSKLWSLHEFVLLEHIERDVPKLNQEELARVIVGVVRHQEPTLELTVFTSLLGVLLPNDKPNEGNTFTYHPALIEKALRMLVFHSRSKLNDALQDVLKVDDSISTKELAKISDWFNQRFVDWSDDPVPASLDGLRLHYVKLLGREVIPQATLHPELYTQVFQDTLPQMCMDSFTKWSTSWHFKVICRKAFVDLCQSPTKDSDKRVDEYLKWFFRELKPFRQSTFCQLNDTESRSFALECEDIFQTHPEVRLFVIEIVADAITRVRFRPDDPADISKDMKIFMDIASDKIYKEIKPKVIDLMGEVFWESLIDHNRFHQGVSNG